MRFTSVRITVALILSPLASSALFWATRMLWLPISDSYQLPMLFLVIVYVAEALLGIPIMIIFWWRRWSVTKKAWRSCRRFDRPFNLPVVLHTSCASPGDWGPPHSYLIFLNSLDLALLSVLYGASTGWGLFAYVPLQNRRLQPKNDEIKTRFRVVDAGVHRPHRDGFKTCRNYWMLA